MGFWDSLTSGVSSVSGTVQGADPGSSGFTQVATTPRAVTNTSTIDTFSQDFVNRAVAQQLQINQEGAIQASLRNKNLTPIAQGGNPYGVQRQPWVFATFAGVTNQTQIASQLQSGQNPSGSLVWYANPKSVEWSISQRGSNSKTKSGTVLHIWRDRLRRTDYDDPKITMTFQTGNIMPSFPDATNAQALQGRPSGSTPPGLNNFYQFLSLVDTSKVQNGQANLIHILYRSRIFPSMVISGFFDPESVVRFSDSADNPFQVNSWSANFTIYRSIPAYNNWSQLAQQFQVEFANDPLNMQIAQQPAPTATTFAPVTYNSTGTTVTSPASAVTSGFDPSKIA